MVTKLPFKYQDCPHVKSGDNKVSDFEFPEQKILSYDNYIIGFTHRPGGTGLNYIMSNN